MRAASGVGEPKPLAEMGSIVEGSLREARMTDRAEAESIARTLNHAYALGVSEKHK